MDSGETPTEDNQKLAGEAGAAPLHAERHPGHSVRPGRAGGVWLCVRQHLYM